MIDVIVVVVFASHIDAEIGAKPTLIQRVTMRLWFVFARLVLIQRERGAVQYRQQMQRRQVDAHDAIVFLQHDEIAQ